MRARVCPSGARREAPPSSSENRRSFRENIIKNIRLIAAAALACACAAVQAQSTPLGADTHWTFAFQVGSVHDNGKTEPAGQLGIGYSIDPTWSVEALVGLNLIILRDGALDAGPYEYDNSYGARVLATLPLGERLKLVGGLGVVGVHEERGLAIGGAGRTSTGAIVSAAAMYRLSRRWGAGVEVSTFTAAHTFNVGVRGEYHF